MRRETRERDLNRKTERRKKSEGKVGGKRESFTQGNASLSLSSPSLGADEMMLFLQKNKKSFRGCCCLAAGGDPAMQSACPTISTTDSLSLRLHHSGVRPPFAPSLLTLVPFSSPSPTHHSWDGETLTQTRSLITHTHSDADERVRGRKGRRGSHLLLEMEGQEEGSEFRRPVLHPRLMSWTSDESLSCITCRATSQDNNRRPP